MAKVSYPTDPKEKWVYKCLLKIIPTLEWTKEISGDTMVYWSKLEDNYKLLTMCYLQQSPYYSFAISERETGESVVVFCGTGGSDAMTLYHTAVAQVFYKAEDKKQMFYKTLEKIIEKEK